MAKLNSCFIFRVDASPNIGYGHLVRCSALAEQIYEKGNDIVFATNYPEEIRKVIKHFKFDLIDLNKFHPFSEEEINYLSASMKKIQHKKAFIVDSYNVTFEYLKNLKDEFPEMLFVAIDDLAEKTYPVDILINGNIYAEKLNYNRQKELGTKLLLGPKYLLLRKEFQNPSPHVIKDKVSDSLVIFGGGGIKTLTEITLDTLLSMNLKDVKIHVVLGENSKEYIEDRFRNIKNIIFYHNLDAKQLRELMEKSDIAISAAGSTLYELAMCGTPTIAIVTADNQKFLIDEMDYRGLIVKLESEDNSFQKILIDKVAFLINNRIRREEMLKKMRDLTNGVGSLRVITEIIKNLVLIFN